MFGCVSHIYLNILITFRYPCSFKLKLYKASKVWVHFLVVGQCPHLIKLTFDS